MDSSNNECFYSISLEMQLQILVSSILFCLNSNQYISTDEVINKIENKKLFHIYKNIQRMLISKIVTQIMYLVFV